MLCYDTAISISLCVVIYDNDMIYSVSIVYDYDELHKMMRELISLIN